MAEKRELSQKQVIDYLKDVSDIEVREFTLRKAVEELKFYKNCFKSKEELQARKDITAAQNQLNQVKKELLRGRPYSGDIFDAPPKKSTENPPQEPPKPTSWDEHQKRERPEHYGESDPYHGVINTVGELIISSVFIFAGIYLVLAILCCIPILILSGIFSSVVDINILSGILPGLAFISIVITVIIAFISRKLSVKKYLKKTAKWQAACAEYDKVPESIEAYNRECEAYNRACEAYNRERDLYPIDCKNYDKYQAAVKCLAEKETALAAIHAEQQAYSAAVDRQIAALQPHIVTLFNQKYELYDLNIIPPDYRTLDCVLMLHQIFRNGLKDSMAEAVLLYEERVFRQEVIQGLDKIYEMLGTLNASMRAVESRLIEVKQEVQMMSSDLNGRLDQMSSQMEKSAKNQEKWQKDQAEWLESQERWQEDLLSESRASRYAAEAVQSSNYKYEWYMEQHRQGLL